MARIRVPQNILETYFIPFCIILLACHPTNGTTISFEYVGCFEVWQNQFTKLHYQIYYYDMWNGLSSCAEKCFDKNWKAQLVFLRGIECKCAPGSELNATLAAEGACNFLCPIWNAGEPMCGGNTAYSVSCVSPLSNSDECKNFIGQQYPINYDDRSVGSTNHDPMDPSPVPEISCGLCERSPIDLCAPKELSPDFDYFPLNSAKECALFCHKTISYAVWEADDEVVLRKRLPTPYAILVWWKVPSYNYGVAAPICLCGDEITKDKFLPATTEHCKVNKCPGDNQDSCGDVVSGSIYGSVYCIEDGTGSCNGGLSPSTTVDTTPLTERGSESTGELDPVVTDESVPSTIRISTTEYSIATGETMAVTPDTSPPDYLKPEPSSSTSGHTTKGTSQGTTMTPTIITTKLPSKHKKCSRRDRYGEIWETGVNKIASKKCSKLIPNSSGTAYWRCNAWGKFETSQPNVTECRSNWMKEMEEKFDDIKDVESDASDYTGGLFAGCGDHSGNKEYFGHEMFELVANTSKTLGNVKTFHIAPTEDQFTALVNDAVDLSACLIVTSPGPWEDLTKENKSRLYTHIVEATDDAMFQLTQYVKSKNEYRKDFVPMKQFTAAAESFEIVRNKSHKFPPQCAPDRKSCISLPPDWTDILQDKRVHVAVITMAPQSVATAMVGKGAYEVNGERNKMLNGRIISLSVTPGSKSLQFRGKGAVIMLRHISDAHGEEPYKIRRKLHHGEVPKAVIGGAQCVFWDTKKNMWSGKGCHLVKAGRTKTTCECSHLTAFAILMKVHSYTGKQRGLEILTLVLCPLSELGLLLNMIVLFRTKKYLCKIRSTICKHLSFCLLLGNGLIITVLDRHNFRLSPGVCIGGAIAGHYILLCAFMWMLLEGVQLYRAVVHVFESGKSYMKHFGVVAYGTPLIIVGITALSGYVNKELPYGGDP